MLHVLVITSQSNNHLSQVNSINNFTTCHPDQPLPSCDCVQGREISPLVAAYVKIRVEEQRKEDEAKGIVRELSFI